MSLLEQKVKWGKGIQLWKEIKLSLFEDDTITILFVG